MSKPVLLSFPLAQHNPREKEKKKSFFKTTPQENSIPWIQNELKFPTFIITIQSFSAELLKKMIKTKWDSFSFFSFFNFNFSECGLLWEDIKGLKRFKKTNWIFLMKKRKKKLKWSLRLSFSLKFLCSLCLKLKRKATDRTWFRTYRFWELYIFSTCRENNGLIFIFYYYFYFCFIFWLLNFY